MNTKNETKDAKTVFNGALDLIRDESRWVTKYLAADRLGYPVDSLDPDAVCWCSLGALGKVSMMDGDLHPAVYDALYAAARESGNRAISDFNDSHPHEEVIALWERVGREQGWIAP